MLRANRSSRVAVTLAFLAGAVQYPDNALGATNDMLDVNLNMIYLGTRSQKGSDAVSEGVIQYPFPLTEHSKSTGQGLFGGITYFDIKTLENMSASTTTMVGGLPVVNASTQQVTEMGLGRIYYSYSVPGDTPYTFVPFITLMRQFSYSYLNASNIDTEVKGRSYLLPGVMYAYRFNEKVAFHFDSELYSYSEINHNRSRIGFSYLVKWPWIVSVSHERIAWDIDGSNVVVDGSTNQDSIKVIFRDPPKGNFALTIGQGHLTHNAVGSALLQPTSNSLSGLYFGVEASGGVLAW